ncbi:MAG: hypothetical protein QXG08_08065 [Candidatus Methanomethyliaceae archaeon]
MVDVDVEAAKQSFEEIIPKIPDRYARKIKKAKWKERAASEEAEKLWADKVAEAAARMRRKKRLEKVSEEEWRKAATELGGKRIGESLKIKLDKWHRNWLPYAETLKGLELPPKTADPMENIDRRTKAVVSALIKKKEELYG